jgi:hypothetical protein
MSGKAAGILRIGHEYIQSQQSKSHHDNPIVAICEGQNGQQSYQVLTHSRNSKFFEAYVDNFPLGQVCISLFAKFIRVNIHAPMAIYDLTQETSGQMLESAIEAIPSPRQVNAPIVMDNHDINNTLSISISDDRLGILHFEGCPVHILANSTRKTHILALEILGVSVYGQRLLTVHIVVPPGAKSVSPHELETAWDKIRIGKIICQSVEQGSSVSNYRPVEPYKLRLQSIQASVID